MKVKQFYHSSTGIIFTYRPLKCKCPANFKWICHRCKTKMQNMVTMKMINSKKSKMIHVVSESCGILFYQRCFYCYCPLINQFKGKTWVHCLECLKRFKGKATTKKKRKKRKLKNNEFDYDNRFNRMWNQKTNYKKFKFLK